MTPKQRAEKLARKLGVEIRRNDSAEELTVEAPRGKHFAACGTHELVASKDGWLGAITWKDLYRAIAEDMALGLEDCNSENPDCIDFNRE